MYKMLEVFGSQSVTKTVSSIEVAFMEENFLKGNEVTIGFLKLESI